ncbi:unnamed protein product [Arctogadus glacialis]
MWKSKTLVEKSQTPVVAPQASSTRVPPSVGWPGQTCPPDASAADALETTGTYSTPHDARSRAAPPQAQGHPRGPRAGRSSCSRRLPETSFQCVN